MIVAMVVEGECCLSFWVEFEVFKAEEREEMDIVSWGKSVGFI